MTLVHINSEKSLPPLTFVLGGAASGKSIVAESLIENSGLAKVYFATGRIWDAETQNRVDIHKARRDSDWTTIDVPIDLPDALHAATPGQAILLDCATMWLTNLMMDEKDQPAHIAALMAALADCVAPVVVVSNEVGQGIVPENAMARAFREAQGRLNMRLADQADVVIHVIAGLPTLLKGDLA